MAEPARLFVTPAIRVRRQTPPPPEDIRRFLPNAVRRTLRSHVVSRLPTFLQRFVPAPARDRAYREWTARRIAFRRETFRLEESVENFLQTIVTRDASSVPPSFFTRQYANFLLQKVGFTSEISNVENILVDLTKYAHARRYHSRKYAEDLFFYDAGEQAAIYRKILLSGLVDLPMDMPGILPATDTYAAIPDEELRSATMPHALLLTSICIRLLEGHGIEDVRAPDLFAPDFINHINNMSFVWWTAPALSQFINFSLFFEQLRTDAETLTIESLPDEIEMPTEPNMISYDNFVNGERIIVIETATGHLHKFKEASLRLYWKTNLNLVTGPVLPKNPATNESIKSIRYIKYATIAAASVQASGAAAAAAAGAVEAGPSVNPAAARHRRRAHSATRGAAVHTPPGGRGGSTRRTRRR